MHYPKCFKACGRLVEIRRVNFHKRKALGKLVNVPRVGFVFRKAYRRPVAFRRVCFDFLNVCRTQVGLGGPKCNTRDTVLQEI